MEGVMAQPTDSNIESVTQHWTADLTTRSGTPVKIRPVNRTDRALIEDFFEHASTDDLRFRFLTSLRHLDEPKIEALCAIDPPTRISFLAFCEGQLAAIGTLAGDKDRNKAEIALCTRPEWKRHGVSWVVFDHIIRFARAHHYQEIISIEKTDNRAALQMEREMGFELSLEDDDGGEMIASKPTVLG